MMDRHLNDPSISLADHLLCVHNQAKKFCRDPTIVPAEQMANVWHIVGTASLFHDIGKPRETDREHPNIGHQAVLEVLPSIWPDREAIAQLVKYHDTPWSWWRSNSVPRKNAWRKLGAKVIPDNPAFGLVLVAIHSMADTHGHEDAHDTIWFIEEANYKILKEAGMELPVPENEVLMEGVPRKLPRKRRYQ